MALTFERSLLAPRIVCVRQQRFEEAETERVRAQHTRLAQHRDATPLAPRQRPLQPLHKRIDERARCLALALALALALVTALRAARQQRARCDRSKGVVGACKGKSDGQRHNGIATAVRVDSARLRLERCDALGERAREAHGARATPASEGICRGGEHAPPERVALRQCRAARHDSVDTSIVLRVRRAVARKMLGGASQIVSRIRTKCNGK